MDGSHWLFRGALKKPSPMVHEIALVRLMSCKMLVQSGRCYRCEEVVPRPLRGGLKERMAAVSSNVFMADWSPFLSPISPSLSNVCLARAPFPGEVGFKSVGIQDMPLLS